MTAEEILCRWAAQRFPQLTEAVGKVTFESAYDHGYSEYTPGIGEYCAIDVYNTEGKLILSHDETDYNELIMEIARVAASLMEGDASVSAQS